MNKIEKDKFIIKMQQEIINAQRTLLDHREFSIESKESRLRYYIEDSIKWLNKQVIHSLEKVLGEKDSA